MINLLELKLASEVTPRSDRDCEGCGKTLKAGKICFKHSTASQYDNSYFYAHKTCYKKMVLRALKRIKTFEKELTKELKGLKK